MAEADDKRRRAWMREYIGGVDAGMERQLAAAMEAEAAHLRGRVEKAEAERDGWRRNALAACANWLNDNGHEAAALDLPLDFDLAHASTSGRLREAERLLAACVEAVEDVGPWGEGNEQTRICTDCGGAGPDGKPDECTHEDDCPHGRARRFLEGAKETT